MIFQPVKFFAIDTFDLAEQLASYVNQRKAKNQTYISTSIVRIDPVEGKAENCYEVIIAFSSTQFKEA